MWDSSILWDCLHSRIHGIYEKQKAFSLAVRIHDTHHSASAATGCTGNVRRGILYSSAHGNYTAFHAIHVAITQGATTSRSPPVIVTPQAQLEKPTPRLPRLLFPCR